MENQITHLGMNHFFDLEYFSNAQVHAEDLESNSKTSPLQHNYGFTTQDSSKGCDSNYMYQPQSAETQIQFAALLQTP